MSQAQQPRRQDFRIDPTGVGLIVALVLVIGPATILASVVVLTHGFDVAATTTFEWIATALVSLLALVMIRTGVAELRGALGVRIDEQGIRRGSLSIAWPEVERIEAPSYGVLEIVAGPASLRLRTYLFRQPKQLVEFIADKTKPLASS